MCPAWVFHTEIMNADSKLFQHHSLSRVHAQSKILMHFVREQTTKGYNRVPLVHILECQETKITSSLEHPLIYIKTHNLCHIATIEPESRPCKTQASLASFVPRLLHRKMRRLRQASPIKHFSQCNTIQGTDHQRPPSGTRLS